MLSRPLRKGTAMHLPYQCPPTGLKVRMPVQEKEAQEFIARVILLSEVLSNENKTDRSE